MKTLAQVLAALAALSGASVAVAGDRATDARYLAAARCQGLAQAVSADTTQIDAYVKAQGRHRAQHVVDKADAARREARRELSRADGYTLQRLTAERGARCADFGVQIAGSSGAAVTR